jgi:hypothetical protein
LQPKFKMRFMGCVEGGFRHTIHSFGYTPKYDVLERICLEDRIFYLSPQYWKKSSLNCCPMGMRSS